MIAETVARIHERIAEACARAHRRPEEVTLVGVGKTVAASRIAEAALAGVLDIGENYVQEMREKRALAADPRIRWHFIGHLQRNKVKVIAPWVHLVHAVDSPELALEIDRRARASGRVVDVLVEVNTSEEETRFGVRPARAPEVMARLAPLENIRVLGLMTMGPFLPDPEASRPAFRRLRLLARELESSSGGTILMRHLSMGMTGDFEVAVEEGATLVRIGTALFGARPQGGTTPA
ncbi:MAG: YggS family pyridoxal phosphate-dependent enzyme [Bacteroidota bacterium]